MGRNLKNQTNKQNAFLTKGLLDYQGLSLAIFGTEYTWPLPN